MACYSGCVRYFFNSSSPRKRGRRRNYLGAMRIARAMLMTEPASIDGNELTDKGYINQRAGLDRRAALVERLYGDPPGEDVIVLQ